MPKPAILTPQEAKRTLVNRLVPTVDRLRQFSTKFGLRPYNLSLVWLKWTGAERGEGRPVEAQRIALIPNPEIISLDAVSFTLMSGGAIPAGSIRAQKISGSYTYDQLRGLMVPKQHEDHIPEPYEFFYELQEDGRGENPEQRAKFRPLGVPYRRAGKIDWTVILERISEDRDRLGNQQIAGTHQDLLPWALIRSTSLVKP